jgi:RecJ-like exonuclease
MATIFTHLDSDGVCSASLMKMTKEYKTAEVFFTHPAGLYKDLQKVDDELYLLDIAIDVKKYPKIYSFLEQLSERHPVVYIDHHALPGNLPPRVIKIHNTAVCTSELVYRYFYHQLPKNADHIAIIGAICDYADNTPLIRELLHHYERRSMFLDAGLLAQGLKQFGNGPNYNGLRFLVDKFSDGLYPCDVKELTRAALQETRKDKEKREKILKSYSTRKNIAWISDPPTGGRSKIAHWIMGDSGAMLGISIRKINHKRNLADITIRGRNLIDLRQIIPPIANSLGGSAGGHSNAIGVRIPDRNILMFLRAVDNKLSELEIIPPKSLKELIMLHPFDDEIKN